MPEEGGDPACWLAELCDACGKLHPQGEACADLLDRQLAMNVAEGGTAGELEAAELAEPRRQAAKGELARPPQQQ